MFRTGPCLLRAGQHGYCCSGVAGPFSWKWFRNVALECIAAKNQLPTFPIKQFGQRRRVDCRRCVPVLAVVMQRPSHKISCTGLADLARLLRIQVDIESSTNQSWKRNRGLGCACGIFKT